jgi:hypothetical protein
LYPCLLQSCTATTWLAALVRRAHVVLMDLRGFRPSDLGCHHELSVVVQAAHLQRVVVRHDAATVRQLAESDMARAPAGRFVWFDAECLG